MSLGLGIFLLVVGAVLTFALNVSVEWADLQLIGWILMVAGVVVIIIGVVLLTRRRHSVVTNRTDVDPAVGTRVDQVDRRDDIV